MEFRQIKIHTLKSTLLKYLYKDEEYSLISHMLIVKAKQD